MKIRQGFVSNSSSSSFIVAVKEGSNTKVKINLEADISDFSEKTIRTKEDLEEHLDYHWGKNWKEEEYAVDLYDECMREINTGNIVLYGCVSTDSGNLVETCLCEHGIPKTKGIKIIQNAER